MKVFTRDYRISGEYSPIWGEYFGGMKPCVLDIEATGLDRTRCKAVLIGLLMRTDSGARITQFLAENHYEEAKVLDAAMDYLEENCADYLITFNGYAYDVPFINARLDANMLGRHLKMYHFDLFRFLRKHTDLRSRLDSMSQMSIENHYGILSDRGDTITGKESVALFDQYAISGNSTIEKVILTHNREDVLHLHRLMYLSLADVPDLHKALSSYGFPAADGRLSVRHAIKRARSGKTASPYLKITGEQIKDPVSCAYFPDGDCPVTATFNATSSSYEIEVPLGSHADGLYVDTAPLFAGREDQSGRTGMAGGTGNADGKGVDGGIPEILRNDPAFVNGYLILDSRTTNLISKLVAEEYLRRCIF